MEAKGKDGRWHDFSELTAEEQERWLQGQREADERWERVKNGSIGYLCDDMQFAVATSAGKGQRLC